MPLKRLLDLAVPAADALARAHRAGVLHRDIKPENLLVSASGYVKVADFGLAKLKPTHDGETTLSGEATLTQRAETNPDQIVATVSYMSPEQVQGQPADVRSDIFSFGIVLYEMATGKSPFRRDSAGSTIAAVLRDTPPAARSLAGSVPVELDRILGKAIDKDPELRYQSMDELLIDLKRLRRELDAGRLEVSDAAASEAKGRGAAGGRGRRVAAWGAAAALALALVGTLLWSAREVPDPEPLLGARVFQLTSLPGLEDAPSWSPDGRQLVYQAEREAQWGLWIRDADGTGEERPLPIEGLHPGLVVTQPAWSPDGRWIAFVAGRGDLLSLFVVPSEGGSPRELVGPTSLTPAWSADGRWLYFSSDRGGQMNLWRARYDHGALGRLQQVTTGRGEDVYGRPDPTGTRVAYSGLRRSMNLWEVDAATGETAAITSETSFQDNATPSPDGRRLAFASNRRGDNHLWVLDRETGSLSQASATPSSGIQSQAAWSLDGTRLYYVRPDGVWEHDQALGSSRRLFEIDFESGSRFALLPDGRRLVMSLFLTGEGEPPALVTYDLEDGTVSPVEPIPEGPPLWDPTVSPDGRHLAVYQEISPTRRMIWTVPLDGEGEIRQLTSGDHEDAHPTWSADGSLVYFVRNHQEIYAVPAGGGEARPVTRIGSFSTTLDYPAASADAKSVLFTRVDKAGDIFVLELPAGE